ncbi:cystatin-2 isoform X2 [Alosa sapidissima]|uniref:cystatin-2 isoform X1 n=1 Tax=Alosa sapidissima TaxID=34773 RepID=UPI001C0A331B|nr:cystatin-2 isoform X1 [Alosa sapidissima]XP_041922460.1 cystatin-2 isoform X2 [Alosa sapidissima]
MEAWYLLCLCISAALCSLDKFTVKGPGPGALRNVSENDPGVQKAVLSGTNAFNNQSNDAFLFKASAIDSAQRQVVKGIKYFLEVEISRTVCRKSSPDTDLANCRFQPKGQLQQTFLCNFQVWSIPWLEKMTTTYFFCRPSDDLPLSPLWARHQPSPQISTD